MYVDCVYFLLVYKQYATVFFYEHRSKIVYVLCYISYDFQKHVFEFCYKECDLKIYVIYKTSNRLYYRLRAYRCVVYSI